MFSASIFRPYPSFLTLPCFSSPLFPRLEVAPKIWLRIWGIAVLLAFPQRREKTTGRKRIFGVLRAQGTCLVAANVVLFLKI